MEGQYHQEIWMKKLLRVIGWLFALVVIVIAFAMVHSTANGYIRWYFRVGGTVTVDGRKTGYLHANTTRTMLLVTRTDESRPETYLVPLPDRRFITDCGDWHPIRFLPMPIGDINPPCSIFTDPATVQDAPVNSTLSTSRRSIEFLTASGKRIKAEW